MPTNTKLVLSSEKVQLKMAELFLNPYDLCSRAGISYPSYQRIIKTGGCKLSTLGKIATALNVPVTDIIENAAATATQGNE